MKRLAKNEIKEGMQVISLSSHPIVGVVVHVGAVRHVPNKAFVDVVTPDGLFKSLLLNEIGLYETEWKHKRKRRRQVEEIKPRFVRRKK